MENVEKCMLNVEKHVENFYLFNGIFIHSKRLFYKQNAFFKISVQFVTAYDPFFNIQSRQS